MKFPYAAAVDPFEDFVVVIYDLSVEVGFGLVNFCQGGSLRVRCSNEEAINEAVSVVHHSYQLGSIDQLCRSQQTERRVSWYHSDLVGRIMVRGTFVREQLAQQLHIACGMSDFISLCNMSYISGDRIKPFPFAAIVLINPDDVALLMVSAVISKLSSGSWAAYLMADDFPVSNAGTLDQVEPRLKLKLNCSNLAGSRFIERDMSEIWKQKRTIQLKTSWEKEGNLPVPGKPTKIV